MLCASVWLMLSSMLIFAADSLPAVARFPKPLTLPKKNAMYLENTAPNGDLEARNILIERNLRLVAHIMNKG